jgi:hypothetical protein
MDLYVPCECGGKESPCFACCETGKIGPLSIYEYNAYYENKRKREESE